jgi:hypothetical protein
MTGNTERLEVALVVWIGDELELHDVMNLERLGRTALDAGVAVTPLDRLSRPLPGNAVPDPAPRVGGVALPLSLPLAVSAGPALSLLPATAWAEPQHRYPLGLGFLLILTVGCADGTFTIFGVGFTG